MCEELGGSSEGCKGVVIDHYQHIKSFFVNLLGSDEGCLFFGMCGRGVEVGYTAATVKSKHRIQ